MYVIWNSRGMDLVSCKWQHSDVSAVSFVKQAFCPVISDKVISEESGIKCDWEYYWGTSLLQVKIWANIYKTEGKDEWWALQPFPALFAGKGATMTQTDSKNPRHGQGDFLWHQCLEKPPNFVGVLWRTRNLALQKRTGPRVSRLRCKQCWSLE